MKRTTPLLLMLLFGLTALWTSVQSYRMARREIADQLTEALLLTQAEMPADWLTTDTIRQFRSHIRQPEIREKVGLTFYVGEANKAAVLCSHELAISPSLRVRGYVSYSAWQVWRLSDQWPAGLLSLASLLFMALSLRRLRVEPTLVTDVRGQRLTPMQEQLVGLLMSAPGRSLDKQSICQVLWPGKPDASETLYTLVRRTKQALEREGRYAISSERGRSYRIDVL